MRLVTIGACFWLAACGGGGSEGGSGGGGGNPGNGGGQDEEPPDPRLARLDDYDALRLRVLGDVGLGRAGLALTDFADIPTFGEAAFRGSVAMRIETAPQVTVLAGDTQIDIDFETGEMSGRMNRIFGTDQAGDLHNFDGALDVDGDAIVDPGENGWQLNYQGTLQAPAQDLDFDGQIDGAFFGDDASAIAGSELDAGVRVNGSNVDGIVTIIAEQ